MSRAASTTGRGEVARTPRVLQVTTALYRRYRPETFADVIGQEHVTDPLRQALRADRITHAYLFSGPRGRSEERRVGKESRSGLWPVHDRKDGHCRVR